MLTLETVLLANDTWCVSYYDIMTHVLELGYNVQAQAGARTMLQYSTGLYVRVPLEWKPLKQAAGGLTQVYTVY